jgi:hypothetical protein
MAPRLINGPQELTRAVRAIHENVTAGTLELIETHEVGPEGQLFDVGEGGPRKEFLRIRLKCSACQQSFDHSLCGDLQRRTSRVDVA